MSLREVHIKSEYRSLIDNVVNDFYIPVLQESILYQRAVGFFSSSALIAISRGIDGLIKNEGKMQIIASPRLSPEDIEEISKGYEIRKIVEQALLRGMIGMVNQKTTAVRLIPVIGKDVGDMAEFGGLLGYAPIMPVNEFGCEAFISRKGRIPAPIHSFKN